MRRTWLKSVMAYPCQDDLLQPGDISTAEDNFSAETPVGAVVWQSFGAVAKACFAWGGRVVRGSLPRDLVLRAIWRRAPEMFPRRIRAD